MKDKYTIWLDGVSNREAGIVIASPLKLGEVQPKVTTHSIPGRNGDLHIYDGSFKNRRGTVSAYVYDDGAVKRSFALIHKWLWGNPGYRRLETDDDIDHYMMARVKSGAAVDARIRRIAPFAVEFDCKPQRFLKSGEEKIAVTSGMTLYNPTAFDARPIIEVTLPDLSLFPSSSGNGTVTVGDAVISISGMKYGTGNRFSYDAENDDAQSPTGGSRNRHITVTGNVILPPGEIAISYGGEVTAVSIIPRWWEL